MNSNFGKQVADLTLSRGLSRASVLCALLMAVREADTSKVPPAKYEHCLSLLRLIPKDVSRLMAFTNLCRCTVPHVYGLTMEDEAEKHAKGCLYVAWRDLIDEPLERLLAEVEP
jgi:hypothetical protein